MRLRTLLAVGSFGLSCVCGVTFVGCGSDDPVAPVNGGDAGDATDDALGEGGAGEGGTQNPLCKPAGQACASSVDCCTANCDDVTGLCAPRACSAPSAACTVGTECCTVSCINGACSDRLCTSDGRACATDGECCGGSCVGGDGGAKTCKALNGSCKTAGNACAGNGECCSKVCNNGVCDGRPSFCTQTNDACATDFECCGGKCARAAGAALGLCQVVSAPGTPGCSVAGQVCGAGAAGAPSDGGIPECGGECCSRACGPYGPTGVLVCQPPSGCRPTGETCRDGKDCCGFGGVKGVTGTGECAKEGNAALGRCDNGNACRPAGAICKLATMSCNAENNCCAGNVNQNPLVCQQDLLGIPRCTAVGSCADAGSKQGAACATSVDCCGLPCVPNPAGGTPTFICGATCVPTSGACTSSADCCPGVPCVSAPGSTVGVCGGDLLPDGGVGGGSKDAGLADGALPPPPPPGTCALQGQVCTSTGECCNGLSCTNGRCQIPIK